MCAKKVLSCVIAALLFVNFIKGNSNMNVSKKILMTILRDKKTSIDQFRIAAHQIALILAEEALALVPTKSRIVTTPVGHDFVGAELACSVILVPILRSGLALLPAFLKFFPTAQIGVAGLKRDEQTAIAHWYYKNIPTISPDAMVIVLDPMLATGGSLLETLGLITSMGVDQKRIIFAGVISAQTGIDAIRKKYPDITMVIADGDLELNDKKYIVPGLGDFGDRYFGTLAN